MTRHTADELVEIVHVAFPLVVEERTPDDGRPLDPRELFRNTDGRPVALDLAIVELLVEIRDLLRDELVEDGSTCPVCGSDVQVTFPLDGGTTIGIVGCGNPWHYTFADQAVPHG